MTFGIQLQDENGLLLAVAIRLPAVRFDGFNWLVIGLLAYVVAGLVTDAALGLGLIFALWVATTALLIALLLAAGEVWNALSVGIR
jgi:hypothetical protein